MTTQKNNIFLIGPMGSGKTSVGKALAKKLKKKFYDSDTEIEKICGASINWIFDVEGEQKFREREEKVIEQLTQKQNIALATGGGVILRESNRENLKRNGFVVYLQVSIEEQLVRLEKSQTRPLLKCNDRRGRLANLIEQREQYYFATADLVILTDNRSIQSIVEEICVHFKL